MTDKPAAVCLAEECQGSLETRFEKVRQNSSGSKLQAFLQVVERGRPAVNMSLRNCVNFLVEGEYLNAHQRAAAKGETHEGGEEELLREMLGKWFRSRTEFERTLRFDKNAHYAALNLGGAGAFDYGKCCVVLEKRAFPHATCCAGDSLRAFFYEDDKRVDWNEIQASFATRQRLPRLMAVFFANSLAKDNDSPALDPLKLRGELEEPECPVEIHIHGPVTREDVLAVVFTRQYYNYLLRQQERATLKDEPWPKQFANVKHFQRLRELLEQYSIPLLIAEST